MERVRGCGAGILDHHNIYVYRDDRDFLFPIRLEVLAGPYFSTRLVDRTWRLVLAKVACAGVAAPVCLALENPAAQQVLKDEQAERCALIVYDRQLADLSRVVLKDLERFDRHQVLPDRGHARVRQL